MSVFHRSALSTGNGGRSRYLSPDERIVIADLLREGAPQAVIAEQVGRSPSSIGREVRRSRHPVIDRTAEAADRAVPGHWEGDLPAQPLAAWLEREHQRAATSVLLQRRQTPAERLATLLDTNGVATTS